MRLTSSRIGLVVGLALAPVVASCSVDSSTNSQDAERVTVQEERHTLNAEGVFVDLAAGCKFRLPQGGFSVLVAHFSKDLPYDNMRHQLTIVPDKGASLARIDMFEDPERLPVDRWVETHLEYLLEDGASVSRLRIGRGELQAVQIERPRSPQAFASRTVVVAEGGRVAVITGSNVQQGVRHEQFEQLLSNFDLEVTP